MFWSVLKCTMGRYCMYYIEIFSVTISTYLLYCVLAADHECCEGQPVRQSDLGPAQTHKWDLPVRIFWSVLCLVQWDSWGVGWSRKKVGTTSEWLTSPHLTSPVRSQQVEDNILNWLPPPLLPRHSLKSEIWELFWELGYFCNIRIKNNILTIFQHQFKITTDLYIDTMTQRHSIFNIKHYESFLKLLYVNTMLTEAATSWISLAQSPSHSSTNLVLLTSTFTAREERTDYITVEYLHELWVISSPTSLYSVLCEGKWELRIIAACSMSLHQQCSAVVCRWWGYSAW